MELYPSLLAKLARLLDGAGIPYMVIGGQAVLLHGEPRLTRDIDLTLGCDAGELGRILPITTATGLQPVTADTEGFVKKTNVLPLVDHSTGIRVDMIFSFTPYEAEAISRSTVVQLEGTGVHFAAVEDLIVHKLVAGRPRDLEDLRGVLARNPRVDEPYLLRWLPSFRNVVARDLLSEYLQLKGPHSQQGD
jgi:hypothetical protein